MFRYWLSQLRRGLGEKDVRKLAPVKDTRRKHRQLAFKPSLENLEDRTVPNVTGVVFQDYFANGLDYTISTPLNSAGGGTIAGPIDPGVAGITVTAGQAGTLKATATTASNGTYTLTLPTAGQYTIRFTNIPSPLVAGPNGNPNNNPFHFPTLSDGIVQSVSNGSTANLGVVNPGQLVGYDPQLTTTEFYVGAPSSVPSTDYGIEGYYYLAGAQPGLVPPVAATPPGSPPVISTSPPPPTFLDSGSSSSMPLLEVPYSATGPVSAIAWNQSTDTLYAAAYYKDFTTFPTTFTNPVTGAVTALSNPQGQIYAIHLNSNGTLNYVNGRPNVTLFANLDTLATGSADYQGSGDPNFPGTSNQATDAVGEEGLGGMAISPNGSTLYVMALGNRTLYSISTATAKIVGTPLPVVTTLMASATPIPDATDDGNDIRPFAVTYYENELYVGLVNTAESTVTADPALGSSSGTAADLNAYVYQINPTTLSFGGNFAALFQMNLDYPRGYANQGGLINNKEDASSADWLPWSPFQSTSTQNNIDTVQPTTASVYPQPMLSSIAFDTTTGNMTLGFRDRNGDESAPAISYNFTPNFPTARPAGDVIEVFRNPSGSNYELEADGMDPFVSPVTSATISPDGATFTVVFSEDVDCTTGAGITITDISIANTLNTYTATYDSGSGTTTLVFTLSGTVNNGDLASWSYDTATGTIVPAVAGGLTMSNINDTGAVNESTQNPTTTPALPPTGTGPGGGEFYYQQYFTDAPAPSPPPASSTSGTTIHDHVPMGSVIQLPGFPDVITTDFDPIIGINPDYSGGIRWFNTTSLGSTVASDPGAGEDAKEYEIYFNPDASNTYLQVGQNFGKSNGFGGMTAISGAVPHVPVQYVAVSGTVWYDPNDTGILNTPVLANVKVELLNSAGTLLATALTNAAGQYLFSDNPSVASTSSSVYGVNGLSPDSNYFIVLSASNFAAGGALYGWGPDRAFVGTNTAVNSKGVLMAILGVTYDGANASTGDPGSDIEIYNFGLDPLSKTGFIH